MAFCFGLPFTKKYIHQGIETSRNKINSINFIWIIILHFLNFLIIVSKESKRSVFRNYWQYFAKTLLEVFWLLGSHIFHFFFSRNKKKKNSFTSSDSCIFWFMLVIFFGSFMNFWCDVWYKCFPLWSQCLLCIWKKIQGFSMISIEIWADKTRVTKNLQIAIIPALYFFRCLQHPHWINVTLIHLQSFMTLHICAN